MIHFITLNSSTTPPPPRHHRPRHVSTPKSTNIPSSSSTIHTPPPTLSTVRLNSIHKASKLEDFENVVASGVEGSELFVECLSGELVVKGVVRSVQEGRVWEVVEVFRKVEKLGVEVGKLVGGMGFRVLREECGRLVDEGEVAEAVELIEVLGGFRFSIKDLMEPSRIIKVCVENHDPRVAVRYACLHPHMHVLFCTIIHEFGKKKDLASALTVFEASKQKLSHPNMYIYRTIIDVCGLCGGYLKTRSIYEELLNQNVTPNIFVFNSLMNVNASDLSYTMSVYQNMQRVGVAADMASYNILLKACCLAGRVDLARDIYKEVQHMQSTGLLKLDVFTYSTIIKVFADSKLWQMALRIKEDMLSAGITPNTVTWSSLINACANSGLVEQAIKLFEEMLEAGSEPNSQCCNTVLHACVEARQYDRAFRIFQYWKGNNIQQNSSRNQIADTDCILKSDHIHNNSAAETPNYSSDRHHFRLAKRFSFKPTATTYNILMKACGSDYHRAKALMDEMKTVGLSPNYISWSTLINICGGVGDLEGSIRTLRTMYWAGIKPDVVAYTAVIKVCVERKKLKLAFTLFEEMKSFHVRPNLVTYNTLLRARNRYGSLDEVQQCLAIYQEMRKAGYKPNDYYLKELIEEWCEGVIQGNNHKQESTTCNKTDTGRPHNVLLEKVAAHLQKSTTETLAIDLQGLTKVEARIVVLAVLRMMKENYSKGILVKDDIMIVLGFNEVEANAGKPESEVKDAVIRLLQGDLGLEVRNIIPRISYSRNPATSDLHLEAKLGTKNSGKEKPSTRRPVILQRLKITKRSLNHWLQRRLGTWMT